MGSIPKAKPRKLEQGKLSFTRKTVEKEALRNAPLTDEQKAALEADRGRREFQNQNRPKLEKRPVGRPKKPRLLHHPDDTETVLFTNPPAPNPLPDLNEPATSKTTRSKWWHPATIIPILREVKHQCGQITRCVSILKTRYPETYVGLNESTVRTWYITRPGGRNVVHSTPPQLKVKA